ncbi:unnamed protein product, partial [Nippostrongylus brasiliensis]|uniref:RNA-dependent RNA polymerase n=1 Tax=Nippostrongylus brasiliensis TaxID=27835 RepID=A0A0N4XP58_NIPBR
FQVKKGDIVAIPTHAIPYYAKYDDATDSSSQYSDPPDEIREFSDLTNENRAQHIINGLLRLGFDYDGRPLSDDVIFAEADQVWLKVTRLGLCGQQQALIPIQVLHFRVHFALYRLFARKLSAIQRPAGRQAASKYTLKIKIHELK